ncbi:MAG: RAMP superfamily CRISPR-associated protein [Limnochordia bacterium]|nr:RAMP superfamily CRISPR-associated protein [Limnochordia bacterium]
MTSLQLKIQILSPTTLGAGQERRGTVDTDVVFDDYGLPYIPGKRLKGLWRDAYQDVGDALWEDGIQLPIADELFGERGAAVGGPLIIGDAYLPAKASMQPWLHWFIYREKPLFSKYDVLETLTSIRRQTAIDYDSGAAKKDTLRSIRVVNPGQVFVADITLQMGRSLTQKQLMGLALAASGLKCLGASRTRGFGAVRCSLERAGMDLSAKAIDFLLGKATIDEFPVLKGSSGSPLKLERGKDDGRLAALQFSLTLHRPAICARLWGDSYTVSTYRYIPGSTIKGAVAWAYIRNLGGVDDDFQRLFVDGGLRFLNAYPMADGRRSLPIPRSIRKEKGDEFRLYDLAYYQCIDEPVELPRLERQLGFAVAGPGNKNVKVPVATRLSPHHVRAQDRRFGRAKGNPSDDDDHTHDGTFFSYESIEAGQRFAGVILGSASDLEFVKRFLQEQGTIWVGRSKGAEYGGNATIDLGAVEVVDEDGFMEGWAPAATTGSCLVVNLLSPLLSTNGNGHPAPEFPKEELAELMGVAPEALQEVAQFSRMEWVGGYQSHLGFPRTQWPALASGSTWVFAVATDHKVDLSRERNEGLGLRKDEGFGRISLGFGAAPRWTLGKAESEWIFYPTGAVPEEVLQVVEEIILRQAYDEVSIIVNQVEVIGPLPTKSLLGRLGMMLRSGLSIAKKSIESLRDRAREPLEKCYLQGVIREDHKKVSLKKHLVEVFASPEKTAEILVAERVIGRARYNWSEWEESRQVQERLLADPAVVEKLCYRYLVELLAKLRRQADKRGDGI